ncbi:hypothetical protein [Streptomyces sp. NPDC002763]|uniref:DUF7660 family protein n=1 Tax=Streptomyces sp. NPDC002763 TaxID=3154427 RepID=UPI00332D50C6
MGENADLASFLETLAAWIDDADGWYGNAGRSLPADGDWSFFARALRAATSYEQGTQAPMAASNLCQCR